MNRSGASNDTTNLPGIEKSSPDRPKRSPLLRVSRRTRWHCRGVFGAEERFRRATRKQLAAQAIAAHEFGIPIRRLTCDARRAYATLDAAWLSLGFQRHDDSVDAREALERDCLTITAGIVARAFALGFTYMQNGWHDQELLFDLMGRIEYHDGVMTQWHDYLRERARDLVGEPRTWSRIENLARQLEIEREMDGDRIAALLREPLLESVIAPAQIPWRAASSPPSNVELVWCPPSLTEILAQAVEEGALERGDS